MRWALLATAVSGFASVWGVVPGFALLAAFVVMFTNFATFCLLYERPNDRARQRVTQLLAAMHPNTDAAQRLSTAPITTTAADRQLGYGPMSLVNLASGVAGGALLVWGIVLRVL